MSAVATQHPPQQHARPPAFKPVGVAHSLVSGAVAGAIAKTVIAPLERVKILFQVTPNKAYSLKAALNTVHQTYRTEGLAACWKGNSATILRIMPSASIQFTSHQQYKRLLMRPGEIDLSPARRFIAGALAGSTATICTYPLDLMRARLAIQARQSQVYHSMRHAFVTLWRTEGFLAFYQGLTPALVGIIPYAGASFFAFETMKKLVREYHAHDSVGTHDDTFLHVDEHQDHPHHEKHLNKGKSSPAAAHHSDSISPIERLVCGAFAGLIGQTTTYPLDVVRRRMQTDGFLNPGQRKYRSILGTFVKIMREEGVVGGLYRGLSMNWIKGPVAAAVSFTTFDALSKYLESRAET